MESNLRDYFAYFCISYKWDHTEHAPGFLYIIQNMLLDFYIFFILYIFFVICSHIAALIFIFISRALPLHYESASLVSFMNSFTILPCISSLLLSSISINSPISNFCN